MSMWSGSHSGQLSVIMTVMLRALGSWLQRPCSVINRTQYCASRWICAWAASQRVSNAIPHSWHAGPGCKSRICLQLSNLNMGCHMLLSASHATPQRGKPQVQNASRQIWNVMQRGCFSPYRILATGLLALNLKTLPAHGTLGSCGCITLRQENTISAVHTAAMSRCKPRQLSWTGQEADYTGNGRGTHPQPRTGPCR